MRKTLLGCCYPDPLCRNGPWRHVKESRIVENPGGWLPVFAVKAPWCVCVVREGGGGGGQVETSSKPILCRLKQAVNPSCELHHNWFT